MADQTDNQMSEKRPKTTIEALLGDVSKNWGWFMAAGLVMVVLGVIALQMEVGITLTAMKIVGAITIAAGIISIVTIYKTQGWKNKIWNVLIGLAYLAMGIMMVADPAASAAWFTLFIAAGLMAIGILRILGGLSMRNVRGWLITIISGVAALVLGILIFMQWPVSGLWVIGMFIAIDFIMQGISLINIAWAARSFRQQGN